MNLNFINTHRWPGLLLGIICISTLACRQQPNEKELNAKTESAKEENDKKIPIEMDLDSFVDKGKVIQFTTGRQDHLIGGSAPEFTMTDMEGNILSSTTTKGKVVVLNFWFTKCKPCVDEMPELNEIYDTYKDHPDIVFASVTFNKKDEVQSFLKETPFYYPAVTDSQNVCDTFNVMSYPTNIVIDKEGKYSEYILGGFPDIGEQIKHGIENVLNSK